MDQDLIFLVLLDLQKAYDNLDRCCLLNTWEGYEAGPKMQEIMMEFWVRQEVVTRKNGYHGPQFRAARGTTQGGMKPPTLLNVEVDSVVRYWLPMKVGDNAVIHDGLGHGVGRILGVFYEEDSILGLQDLECIQGSLNVLIGLLLRIGQIAPG